MEKVPKEILYRDLTFLKETDIIFKYTRGKCVSSLYLIPKREGSRRLEASGIGCKMNFSIGVFCESSFWNISRVLYLTPKDSKSAFFLEKYQKNEFGWYRGLAARPFTEDGAAFLFFLVLPKTVYLNLAKDIERVERLWQIP